MAFHFVEEVLLEDVHRELFLFTRLDDLVAQDRQLSEELARFTLRVLSGHCFVGRISPPADDALKRLAERLQVPEVLHDAVEEAIVVAIVIRQLETPVLFVIDVDRLARRWIHT